MPEDSAHAGERLAKRIARAGICSRRDAEKLITAGRVSVNGKKVVTPAFNVTPDHLVAVDGEVLAEAEKSKLWLYHKPTGLLTTHKDARGRPTVFDELKGKLPRVISVGRLDLNSEGLLLLTNDGALARHLELPATGWVRRYRARIYGDVTPEVITKLARGVTVEGVRYGSVEVTVERVTGKNCWALVKLTEGKNREIRRLFEHFECKVSRLIRISYGPFQLGALEPGEVEPVPGKTLKEALGKEFG